MYSSLMRRSGANSTNNNNSSSSSSSSSSAISNNVSNNNINTSSAANISTTTSAPQVSLPSPDKYERFENWLRENGAKFELLELREYDTEKPTLSDDDENCEEKKEAASGVGSGVAGGGRGRGGRVSDGTRESKFGRRSGGNRGGSSSGAGHVSTSGNFVGEVDGGEAEDEEEKECEMRGVHARTHIPPNTVCVTIPRRCLITVEMGQATPIGQAILNSDLDLDAPKHIFLMIYLLWDKKVNGKNSFFFPYYEILPKTLSNMPIFWTPEELEGLKGSYLLTQIADRNDAIAEDYHSICQIAPLKQICTLDEFKWARMCVCSRNFGLQIDGHRTSALVPHADMLNHYRPRETKWTFDEDRQAFTITTLQHIPAGAQVYDSYGQKCNHRFLLNYGFAVEDNRELDGFCPDEVPIELYVSPDDPLFTQKLEFWTRGEPAAAAAAAAAAVAAAAAAAAASTTNRNSKNYNNFSSINSGSSPMGGSSGSATHNNNNSVNHTNNNNFLASPVIKRIRVCVSNNENTRLLCSLLRALVCNREELRAITSPVANDHHYQHSHHNHHLPLSHHTTSSSNHYHHHHHNHPFSSSATTAAAQHYAHHPYHHQFGSATGSRTGTGSSTASNSSVGGGNSASIGGGVVSRALFGLSTVDVVTRSVQANMAAAMTPSSLLSSSLASPSSGNSSSSHTSASLASAAATTSYYRTCRDVRHPISIRNERAAMTLLLEIISKQLSQYPTTLQDDINDLMNENEYPRFSNKRHAKIQVRGEKIVLHHYIKWAKIALDVIDVIEEELQMENFNNNTMLLANNSNNDSSNSSTGIGAGFEVQLVDSDGSNAGGNFGNNYFVRSGNGSNGSTVTAATVIEEQQEQEHTINPNHHHHHHHQQQRRRPGFEYIIRRMEEDESGGIHHTILRYCADVLGSLRREEFKNLRRRGRVSAARATYEQNQHSQQQQLQHHQQHYQNYRQQQQQLQEQQQYQQQQQQQYGGNNGGSNGGYGIVGRNSNVFGGGSSNGNNNSRPGGNFF